jgi:hypothetical protein
MLFELSFLNSPFCAKQLSTSACTLTILCANGYYGGSQHGSASQ